MTVKITGFSMVGEAFDATLQSTGKRVQIAQYGVPDEGQEPVVLQAMGGRWAEYDEDIVSVDFGTVKKQMDGKTLIDFGKVYSPRTVNGVTASGQPVIINVSQRPTSDTFAPSTYYMPETDEATGDVLVEPGDYSRDIYISKAPGTRTIAMIAAEQDPPIADTAVTGAWLLARPQYGGSPEMKITHGAASRLIAARYGAKADDSRIQPSDVLYFERGYDYSDFSLERGHHGESPLHPRQFRAFGTGPDPKGVVFGGSKPFFPSHYAFIGVAPHYNARNHENCLLADTTFPHAIEYNSEKGAYLTLYRTAHYDIRRDVPTNGTSWRMASEDRINAIGFYHDGMTGSLVWGATFDHVGWGEPYNVDGTYDPVTGLQPPTIYVHSMYMGEFANHDITWEDVVSMRPASVSGQMRPGGWQIGNTSIRAGVGWQNQGRPYNNASGARGSWPVTIRGVATKGIDRPYIGDKSGGKHNSFDFKSIYPVIVDTLGTHVDVDGSLQNFTPISWGSGAIYENHTEMFWKQDRNLIGIDMSFAETITLEAWAAAKTGNPDATEEDYYAYVRTLTPRQRHAENKALNQFFLTARGANRLLPPPTRTAPQTLHFRVNPITEGFRLDNPLNWTSGDRPIPGDSVDLHGNRVKSPKETLSLNVLTTGTGGAFEVSGGRISFESANAGAKVKTELAGKLYIKNFNGDAEVRGGRFINIGNGQGNIDASGQGQTVVGNFTVGDGQKARICGDMLKFGWDAIAPAGDLIIGNGGTLEFHATPVIKTSSTARQLYLGELKGGTSGVTGIFDSWRRTGEAAFVRIRDMVGTPIVGETGVQANPEELDPLVLTGTPINEIRPARIGKIEAGWRGRIGAATGAAHNVVFQAGSNFVISNRHLMAPGTYDLGGGAGTNVTFSNPGNITLPAGVVIAGDGKATLTIS